MTTIAQIVKAAQQAINDNQPSVLDPVELARSYFGPEAWREIDQFRETGELPQSIRGLELLAIDIRLDEEV